MARAGGVTGGRDANVHFGDHRLGCVGMVSMLPDMALVANGMALGMKMRREPRVALTFFGEGSTANGQWHEAMNFAGVYGLPVVFVLENNRFAYSTPNELEFAVDPVERARTYGFDGVVVDGKLVTTDLVEINLAIRILLGSSYFDDWSSEETFVHTDPLGNPVDKRHPWNKVTLPKPQKRDWTDKYSWVVSPRMYDARNDTYVACDTGGGPFARQWVTAKAGLVDIGYLKATGHSLQMVLPKTATMPEMELEWHVPEKSNAIERDRARSYHQAYSALVGLHCLEKALAEIRADPYTGDLPRDPSYLSWTLAACAPLPLHDRQALLEAEDAGERLRLVTDLLRSELHAMRVLPSLPATDVARTRWSPN